MFIVILFMLSGIIVGYLLRHKNLSWISKAITILIWTLLFLLGIEVGGNKEITNNLHLIGIDAIIISLGAITGSIIGAKLLWNWRNKDKKS